MERRLLFLDDGLPGRRHAFRSGRVYGMAGIPHNPDMDPYHTGCPGAAMRGGAPHCADCHVFRGGAQNHPA